MNPLLRESVQTKTLPDDRPFKSFTFATGEDLNDLDAALEEYCYRRICIPEILYTNHEFDIVPLGYEYP